MTTNQNSNVPPGWVGGFAASNPAFAYPTPDLMALKMLGNMDNIPRLRRQQKVLWPEFSWETVLGKPASRCFQMFAPDISRLGYDDTGRVWSIICPQQGVCEPSIGCLNVEVTVTGQRGWADETNREVAADMTSKVRFGSVRARTKIGSLRKHGNFLKKAVSPIPRTKQTRLRSPPISPEAPTNPSFQFGQAKVRDLRVLTLPSTQKHGQLEMWKCRSAQSKRQIMTPSIPLIKESWIYSTWLLATCYSLTMCCLGTSGSRRPSS
jgi:hypothetical protein